MKIKSERDFGSGLMFTAVGLVIAVGARHYHIGGSVNPGPGYIPLLLGALLAMLGGVVLFKSLTIETEGGDAIGDIAWRPLLAIVGGVVVFGGVLPRLGIVITVPLLVVIASLASTPFKWKGVLAQAVLLTLAAWLIVVLGLKLNIPLWPMFSH